MTTIVDESKENDKKSRQRRFFTFEFTSEFFLLLMMSMG